MKKILMAALSCLMLTGCGNAESKASNEVTTVVMNTTATEKILTETIETETILTETVLTETIETEDIWISPEYLAELEFNSMTNQW